MGNIVEAFGPLEDPRGGNGERHSLHDILVIALCTVLCGGDSRRDMALFGESKREFLESFLPLRNGIPSHDTFSRVFRLLDPDRFHHWFLGFMGNFAQACQGVLAPDGKTLRRSSAPPLLRSYDRAEGSSPPHLVNAWAAEHRLALGQLAVAGKSNEVTAVPKLLELLSLPEMVVAADAMQRQRQVAQQVVEQAADYVLALKGNQGTLNDVVRLFLDDPATPVAEDTTAGRGHGVIESRAASLSGMWTGCSGLVAREVPLAGVASGGQDYVQPSTRGPDQYGNPLQSLEPRLYPQSGPMTSCAATGESRTNCIGVWT